MNIGIFGGTFDPPHIGHLIVADDVRHALKLDRILFVPASRPPHKRDRKMSPGELRLKLVQRAVAGSPRFRVSDLEITRGGVSYTVDTLEELHRRHPHDALFLLVGMDNLLTFHTWKSPERIIELAKIVAMTRPGFSVSRVPKALARRTIVCPVPEIGVSSSDIRRRVRTGKPFRHLVPEPVYEYIVLHRMYAR
jgi:nicotinate-nucleotide adenylyltransferase